MQCHNNMIRLALTLLCLGAGSAHAVKGYVVTEEVQTPGGKTETKVTYLSETAQRSEAPERTALLVLKNTDLKLYQIDDKARVVKDSSALAPMMLMAYAVFLDRGADGKAQVRPDFATATDETKPIGRWTARKLVTRPMGMTAYAWYTKDSPEMIGADRMRMKFFTTATESFMKPRLDSQEAAQEMTTINKLVTDFSEKMIHDYGAPVMTEIGVGGGRMAATRVVSVESRDIPDSLFELPKGYRLEAGIPQHK
jgi:hypothetical protein